MALTAQLGTVNSKPINLELGRGATIPAFATTTPATLVVEVAFTTDPVTNAGYYYNDLNDGPTSYWRMDNQTLLVDQTGAGNNMTVEGTPTLVAGMLAGDTNQATSFNGTSQDAFALSTEGLNPTGPMTLETWIKTPGTLPGSTVDIIAKRGSYRLQLTPAGKLVFSLKKGTTLTQVATNTSVTTSTVYHVACVYDGARILIYLNKVLDTSVAYSAGIDASMTPIRVGGVDASSTSPTYGTNAFRGDVAPGITVTKPASTANGDYLVAQIMLCTFGGTLPSITSVPAGWVLLGATDANAGQMYAYGKPAGSSEPANYSWNFSGSASVLASISRYTGVSAVAPVGSVSNARTLSGTVVAPTILPSFDNTMIVSLFGGRLSATLGTWIESAGTEQLDYDPSQAESIAINTLAVAGSAPTTVTGTSSVSGELHAIQVELVGTLSTAFTAITVDEMSFFTYGLSAAQITNHYDQAVTPPPTITWSDISADVRTVQIQRGRQYELNRMEAGTATLTLNDDLRKYDPANDSSPYAPNVIPLRQLRIRALLGGNYYPLFQGYIERWSSRWQADFVGTHAECDVTAVDGFEPLSLAALAGTTQSSLSGTAIANLLGAANWPAQARNLDAGAFSVAAITRDARTGILEYIQSVADGEAGIFFIDASSVAVFHDKNHRSTNPLSTVSQGLFGDQTLLALPYTTLVPSKDKDHIVNDWTVTDRDGTEHQAVASAAVINKSFHRTSSRSTFLTGDDAATMATYLLSLTQLPGYRFDEMELTPNTNLPLWLQALQREISDRVTVQRQPVGIVPGSQIVRDCWIERIEWTITRGMPWRVRWQLSPAT